MEVIPQPSSGPRAADQDRGLAVVVGGGVGPVVAAHDGDLVVDQYEFGVHHREDGEDPHLDPPLQQPLGRFQVGVVYLLDVGPLQDHFYLHTPTPGPVELAHQDIPGATGVAGVGGQVDHHLDRALGRLQRRAHPREIIFPGQVLQFLRLVRVPGPALGIFDGSDQARVDIDGFPPLDLEDDRLLPLLDHSPLQYPAVLERDHVGREENGGGEKKERQPEARYSEYLFHISLAG